MGIPNVEVSVLAVIISAAASILFGAFWYSPLLFGKVWAKLAGIRKLTNQVQMQRSMRRAHFFTVVVTLIATYVLAQFVAYLTVSSFVSGVQLSLLVWIAFEVPLTLNEVLWGGKSWKLFLLNAAHHLFALVIGTSVLVAFQ